MTQASLAHIDVIIPCRDVDDYLGDAIASAVNQDDVITHVIVVDAGSRTPIVLDPKWVGHERVTLVRSEDGLLCSGARNAGLAAATSSYLSFLDADDLWPPERCRILLDALEHSGTDIAMGQIEHFSHGQTALNVPEGLQPGLVAGGRLLTRADFDRVGPFDDELRAGEFIDWFNRARIAGLATKIVPDIALRRRVHEASTTASQVEARMDYIKVVRRWMSRND